MRGSGVLDSGVGPAVVHCSAGIGRSGTFCVVDVCLAKVGCYRLCTEFSSSLSLSHTHTHTQLEETRDLNSLDVQELLLRMRKQRLGLIQTPDQLRFSYIAILQVSVCVCVRLHSVCGVCMSSLCMCVVYVCDLTLCVFAYCACLHSCVCVCLQFVCVCGVCRVPIIT